jgi:hypothetical protein
VAYLFSRESRKGAAEKADEQQALILRGAAGAEAAVEITNETPAAARVDLYRTQPCVFITTRILVVDLLNNRLQPHQARHMVPPGGTSSVFRTVVEALSVPEPQACCLSSGFACCRWLAWW